MLLDSAGKFERHYRAEQDSVSAPNRTTSSVRSEDTLLCGLRAVSCVNKDACLIGSDNVLGDRC